MATTQSTSTPTSPARQAFLSRSLTSELTTGQQLARLSTRSLVQAGRPPSPERPSDSEGDSADAFHKNATASPGAAESDRRSSCSLRSSSASVLVSEGSALRSEDARLRRRLRRDRLVQLSQVAVTLLVGVLFYYYMERKPCDAANELSAWEPDDPEVEPWTWRYFWSPSLDYCTEPLTVIDALYLSIVTMTTVGYGDIHPTSNGSRFFTCWYILFGFMYVFATFQALFADSLAVLERWWEDYVVRLATAVRRRCCCACGRGAGHASATGGGQEVAAAVRSLWREGGRHSSTEGGTPGESRWKTEKSARDGDEARPPPAPARVHSSDSRRELGEYRAAEGDAVAAGTEYDLTHPAFNPESALHFYLRNLSFYVCLLVLCVGGGAIWFSYIEGRHYVRGVYFCFVSLSTVGYGDEKPLTQKGKMFVCVYLLICVVLISAVVNKIASLRAARRLKLRQVEMLRKQLDWDMIKRLDRDEGKSVSKLEFVVGMLVILGLVEQGDVEPFLVQFDMLDKDGSGFLDRSDLKEWVDRNRKKYAQLEQQKELEQQRLRERLLVETGLQRVTSILPQAATGGVQRVASMVPLFGRGSSSVLPVPPSSSAEAATTTTTSTTTTTEPSTPPQQQPHQQPQQHPQQQPQPPHQQQVGDGTPCGVVREESMAEPVRGEL